MNHITDIRGDVRDHRVHTTEHEYVASFTCTVTCKLKAVDDYSSHHLHRAGAYCGE